MRVLLGLLLAVPGVPVHSAARPVDLVVGLRQDTAPVKALTRVDARRTASLSDALTIAVPPGKVAETTRTLKADPNVAYVEPDHVAHADAIHPDDPGYAGQWGVVRTRV